MSAKTLGILFIVLLLLGGAAYWQSQQEPEADPTPTPAFSAPPAPVELMPGTASENVISLAVTNLFSDTQRVFEQPEAGVWVQTVPTTTALITSTITGQISGLTRLSSRNAIEADANPLGAYGLDAPEHEITLRVSQDAGIVRHQFLIGDKTATGNGYYIQKSGDDRIHVVTTTNIGGIINLFNNPPFAQPEPEIEPSP